MVKVSSTGQDKKRKGQAVVEFALVLPVFILLLLGAVEFGRAYLDLHLLTNAAREGARVGSLPGSNELDVQSSVNTFLQNADLSGSWSTSVVVKDPDGTTRSGGLSDAQEGDRVYVTVSYNFEVLSGSVIPGWSGTVTLNSNCVFRHE